VADLPRPTVDPRGAAPDAPPPALRPDDGTLQAVARHLEKKRLLTQEVYVRGPRYREVELLVAIAGRPAEPGAVRARGLSELQKYLHPIWGGDDGKGWPFGDPLWPSALIRHAQIAAGDELEVVSIAIRPGNTPGQDETCQKVAIDRVALVALRQVTVTF